MSEPFVIVAATDGAVDTSILHLPAVERSYHDGRNLTGTLTHTWADRVGRGFMPRSWPAACGSVADGWIYVRAGVLADTPVCPACLVTLEKVAA